MSFIGFGKSPAGSDALQIGGHDFPVSVLAAGGTIMAILLVLHARSQGTNVVAVGPAPAASAAAAVPAGIDPTTGFSADAGTLANFSDEITALANGLGNLQSQVAATTVGPPVATANPIQATPAPIDPNTAQVTNDYLAILKRTPDSGGLTWALGDLASNGNTRLLADLSVSPEAATLNVTQDYRALLDRVPDPGGLANYVALYQKQGNDAVIANIKQSTEYGMTLHPAPHQPS